MPSCSNFQVHLAFFCARSKGRLKFSLPSQLCEFQPSGEGEWDLWVIHEEIPGLWNSVGAAQWRIEDLWQINWLRCSWDDLTTSHIWSNQWINIYILRSSFQKRIEQWFTTILAGFYFSTVLFSGLAGCFFIYPRHWTTSTGWWFFGVNYLSPRISGWWISAPR